jgi:DNA-binding transcriptional LysR family regulator
MRVTHLSGVDLNLLPLLDALLGERHLTRAARRVGLSQPAASRALGRLRGLLGDPLLVRSGPSWILTARAEALREPVRMALGYAEAALAPPKPFQPELARRLVRIACDDYSEFVLLAPLLSRISRSAPGLDIEVLPGKGSVLERVARGEADFAFAPLPHRMPSGLRCQGLVEDGFVGMVADSHPFARRAPSLKLFAAARHALIAPFGERGGFVDEALAKLGQERRVALMLPHFLVMPFLVASSDLVLTLSERIAQSFAHLLPVALFRPPLTLPRFEIGFYWHQRDQHDPALGWLREQMLGLRSELDASPPVRLRRAREARQARPRSGARARPRPK